MKTMHLLEPGDRFQLEADLTHRWRVWEVLDVVANFTATRTQLVEAKRPADIYSTEFVTESFEVRVLRTTGASRPGVHAIAARRS